MNRRTLAIMLVAAASTLAHAQGPLTTAFTYQGELRQSGTPATGLFDLRFRLYSAPTGGSQLGSTLCADNVQLSAGRFTVDLDFGAQFSGQQQYLEIDVRPDTGLDCSNTTGYTTLAPRQPITASPNALFSLSAGSAASASTAANATQFNGQSPSFYQNAANLTAGTIPSARIAGTYASVLSLTNSSNTIAGAFSGSGANLTALNASNLASGTIDAARLPAPLSLTAAAPTPTIRGETTSTDSNAAGVFGLASSTTGAAAAVSGQTNSPSGLAGYFQGPAVVLVATSNGDDSIRAYTPGSGKSAIAAFHTTSVSGYGLYGQDSGTGSGGVYGRATATTGSAIGVIGESSSASGFGVSASAPSIACKGLATATSGFAVGVQGVCDNNTSGYGVYGDGQYGVYGTGLYGVWGEGPGIAGYYGVFANHGLGSSGTKSFRIDHPADPENKYLLHYCAEGPEPQNIYNGIVTLDERGQADVALPSYFAAINKDPRYTLTPIGAAMPMLHIARKIPAAALQVGATANPGDTIPIVSFQISGGAPGEEVSWEVKAIRNDRWVQRYGAPVEPDKPASERGTYQRPELYGLGPDRRITPVPPPEPVQASAPARPSEP